MYIYICICFTSRISSSHHKNAQQYNTTEKCDQYPIKKVSNKNEKLEINI